MTAAGVLIGYGIDRALGGDGSVGAGLGLMAGAAFGNLGYANDWSLPSIGQMFKSAGKVVEQISVEDALATMNSARRSMSLGNEVDLPSKRVEDIPPIAQGGGTWDKYTNEQIASLHPAIRGDATAFINKAASQGIYLRIPKYPHPAGFRTIADQKALYEIYQQGGPLAAPPGRSYHNYGLAFDVYQISKGQIVTFDPNVVVPIAQKYGFEWGGSFGDPPHFQKTFGYHWSELQRIYNSGNLIHGRYPNIGR